jgi:hypothetical protein
MNRQLTNWTKNYTIVNPMVYTSFCNRKKKSLTNRAQEYGWNDPIGGILHIPEDPLDINSETNYLIDNYDMISLQEILDF